MSREGGRSCVSNKARRKVELERDLKLGAGLNVEDVRCVQCGEPWGRGVSITAIYELRPSRRSEFRHPRGERQRIVRIPRTPNASRPPHPLPPRDLDFGVAPTLDVSRKSLFKKLQLEDVFALFPTFATFVGVDHLPAEIRAASVTHDFLDGVRSRGHQLDRGPIILDVRSKMWGGRKKRRRAVSSGCVAHGEDSGFHRGGTTGTKLEKCTHASTVNAAFPTFP